MAKSQWQQAFEQRYAQLTGSLPLMHWGNDPARDMAIFERLPANKEYWVLYPLQDYDTDYWSVFYKLFDTDQRKIKLSTALVLSEQMLGHDILGMEIPDAWVLSVEIQAQPTASMVL
jgi:hypothetical protein